MKCSRGIRLGSLMLSAGLLAGSAVLAAPSRADSSSDAFLSALTNAGIASPDPATAVAVGQSVCPMLSEPGQNTANVAAKVADSTGMSLGPSTMFTGIAISIFCPALVSRLGAGVPQLPILGG
ncbi:DUF732 domain-containing protein [Mycobacterium talmoniae]|uniref:DUF732 domain-containing protein n=1 Tax=Mycobacterium talmoniae TaxID=1858794 RepID=A0A1S1N9V3_9MYCO|nr:MULTISPECIES: DUF732 domain-containing protein [Mycobacterium]OHU98434.1 hypothetical protein BKN37_20675 [Mycobacterium talmoniae]TDH51733.1 DUF732 domain-containing protein [Mycobacterium eburneum]